MFIYPVAIKESRNFGIPKNSAQFIVKILGLTEGLASIHTQITYVSLNIISVSLSRFLGSGAAVVSTLPSLSLLMRTFLNSGSQKKSVSFTRNFQHVIRAE